MDNTISLVELYDTVTGIFNIGDTQQVFSATVTKAIRDVNNSRMLSLPFLNFVKKDGTAKDEFTDIEDIDYANSYIITNALTNANAENPDERLYDCIDFFEGPFINYIAYLCSIKLVEFEEQMDMRGHAQEEIANYLNNNDLFKQSYTKKNMVAVSSFKLPSYTPKLRDSSGGTLYHVEEE